MATVSGTNGSDFIHVAGDGRVAPGGKTEFSTATNGDDVILSGLGGSDEIHAGMGYDSIHFSGDLDAGDVIDGGGFETLYDFDTLYIDDQTFVTFGANSLTSIEQIMFSALSLPIGFAGAQSITMNDANLLAGGTLYIDARALNGDTFFSFNGSAELDSGYIVYCGQGSDSIIGGHAGDYFDLSNGGNDEVTSGGGADIYEFGNALTAGDRITGDAAAGGTVRISGTSYYGAGLIFSATTLTNIGRLELGAGFNYAIATNDANLAATQTLAVSAGGLEAPNKLVFDGSAETNGHFSIIGGKGDDVLTGGARADSFDLFSIHVGGFLSFYSIGGGADYVGGGAGNDTFHGATDLMTIDGGTGFDTLYASGKALFDFQAIYTATSMVNIERMIVNIFVTMADGNVAAGKTMQVQGQSGNFDGSAETDGHFAFSQLSGGVWTGGALSDTFVFAGTSSMIVDGGGGSDRFTVTGGFNTSASIAGGDGSDTVTLKGDFSTGTVIGSTMLSAVESIRLVAGHAATLLTEDGVVAAGKQLTIDGSLLAATEAFSFDGSAETDGRFNLKGGAGKDTLTGGAGTDRISSGAGADHIAGGLGVDALNGGQGKDVFVYDAVADSGVTSAERDTITGFVHLADRIDLSAIDAIAGGGLPDDAFTFMGTGGFTGAGQIRAVQSGADTVLRISTDADSTPEATMLLTGVTAATLTAADFML